MKDRIGIFVDDAEWPSIWGVWVFRLGRKNHGSGFFVGLSGAFIGDGREEDSVLKLSPKFGVRLKRRGGEGKGGL